MRGQMRRRSQVEAPGKIVSDFEFQAACVVACFEKWLNILTTSFLWGTRLSAEANTFETIYIRFDNRFHGICEFWDFFSSLFGGRFNLPFRGRCMTGTEDEVDYFRDNELSATLGHNVLGCCYEESRGECNDKS